MRAYTFTNHHDIPVICYVCYIADVACMALVPHRTALPTLPQLTSLLQILPLSCVMLHHGQWSLSPALYCVLFCFALVCYVLVVFVVYTEAIFCIQTYSFLKCLIANVCFCAYKYTICTQNFFDLTQTIVTQTHLYVRQLLSLSFIHFCILVNCL